MKCTVLFFCWFIIQWQVFPIPYLLNEHSISHHSSDVKRFPRQLSLSNTNQNCLMTSGLSLKLKQAVISYTKPRISKYSLVGLLFALRANDRQSKVISNKLILGFFFEVHNIQVPSLISVMNISFSFVPICTQGKLIGIRF